MLSKTTVAARVLATYLTPGCVGRGVRLGSENSSGGGVWKSGDLETWGFGDLGAWKSGNLEIWGPGNPEIWDPKNEKIEILKIQIRSAQNVGKVWISREKILLAPFGPSEAIFCMDRKNQKMSKIYLYSLVGQWALFTWCGPLLLST